jgi:hypothetical protein
MVAEHAVRTGISSKQVPLAIDHSFVPTPTASCMNRTAIKAGLISVRGMPRQNLAEKRPHSSEPGQASHVVQQEEVEW